MAFKDFSKKIVDNITKGLLQNYQNFTSQNQSSWVMGRLNGDGTATLPDGSTVKVITRGITGTYVRLFNMGNGTWLADVPSAGHVQADSSVPESPYMIAYWTDFTGRDFDIITSYAQLIDANTGKVYTIPNELIGYSDIAFNSFIKFSDDGKHIIGGQTSQNPRIPRIKPITIIKNWYLDTTSMTVKTDEPVLVLPFNFSSYPQIQGFDIIGRNVTVSGITRTNGTLQLVVGVTISAGDFTVGSGNYIVYVVPDFIDNPTFYQVLRQEVSTKANMFIQHSQVFSNGDSYVCTLYASEAGSNNTSRAILYKNSTLFFTYPPGAVFVRPIEFPWAYTQELGPISTNSFLGITIPSNITNIFQGAGVELLPPSMYSRQTEESGLQVIRGGYAGFILTTTQVFGGSNYAGNYHIVKFKNKEGTLEGENVFDFDVYLRYPGPLPILDPDFDFPFAVPGVPSLIYRRPARIVS